MASCQIQNAEWLVSLNEGKLNCVSFSSLLIWGFSYRILLSLFCSKITIRCRGLGGRRCPDCQSWRTLPREWATGSCGYLFLLPLEGTAVHNLLTCQGLRVTDSTTPVLLEATCCGLMGPAVVSSDRSQAIDCWAPPPPGANSGTSQFIRWKGRDGTQHVNWQIFVWSWREENPKEVYKSHGWARLWWLDLVCPNLS